MLHLEEGEQSIQLPATCKMSNDILKLVDQEDENEN